MRKDVVHYTDVLKLVTNEFLYKNGHKERNQPWGEVGVYWRSFFDAALFYFIYFILFFLFVKIL